MRESLGVVRACGRVWWPMLLISQVLAVAVAFAVAGLGATHVAAVTLLLPAAGGLSVLVHEIGHLAAIPRPWADVTVSRGHLAVALEHDSRGRLRDVVIAASGPMAAAACGVLLVLAGRVLALPGIWVLVALPFVVHLVALVPPSRDGTTVAAGLLGRAPTTPGAPA